MEDKLKIAVFIDFDNIEIGVKTTLNTELDIAAVLDGLRERGDILAKSAYGDWGRAGSHSRAMTEQAVHMVQRNMTPRGDKNGADINLVVDALEMCFTRPHINGFAIVGGDSDFIALVEKLKQFGKRVLVVGGRAFTSGILQRNCHEFIAYENVLRSRGGGGGGQSRGGATGRLSLEQGFSRVQRALKILADRDVEPQLGPIKSTLLQLDPTFSERDYGVSSFREFVQRLADRGLVRMKRIDQGYLVESTGEGEDGAARGGESDAAAVVTALPEAPAASRSAEEASDLLRRVLEGFWDARIGKPTYVRHLAQALRVVEPDFDERAFGMRSLTELARVAEREGLLRMQRDRQGSWRLLAPNGEMQPELSQEGPSESDETADVQGAATDESGAAVDAGAPDGGLSEAEADGSGEIGSGAVSEPAEGAAPARRSRGSSRRGGRGRGTGAAKEISVAEAEGPETVAAEPSAAEASPDAPADAPARAAGRRRSGRSRTPRRKPAGTAEPAAEGSGD